MPHTKPLTHHTHKIIMKPLQIASRTTQRLCNTSGSTRPEQRVSGRTWSSLTTRNRWCNHLSLHFAHPPPPRKKSTQFDLCQNDFQVYGMFFCCLLVKCIAFFPLLSACQVLETFQTKQNIVTALNQIEFFR